MNAECFKIVMKTASPNRTQATPAQSSVAAGLIDGTML